MGSRESVQQEGVRSYFGQPGFQRFLAALRTKYEASSYGPRGYVTLQEQTAEEFEALDGFYGIYTPGHRISNRYSIAKFERLLLASRFKISIPQLFRLLHGESLQTRGEQKAALNEAWGALIQEAAASIPVLTLVRVERLNSIRPDEAERLIMSYTKRISGWVQGMGHETSPGFRTLRKLFGARPMDAKACLADCIRILVELSAVHARAAADNLTELLPIRLPVISAQMTGNAHALDWKYPLGRILWWGLAACFHEKDEGSSPNSEAHSSMTEEIEWGSDDEGGQAEEDDRSLQQALMIREGYRNGGIADDDLSSQVLFFAPGRDSCWEERVLTLRQVEKMGVDELRRLQTTSVYAVENPSVFAILMDGAARKYEHRWSSGSLPEAGSLLPILVCVNGQPSVAVIKLLECLLGKQTDRSPTLFYSGDLDVAGLDIALGLYHRFPHRCFPWKMDVEQYTRYAQRGMSLTLAERERFTAADFPWDPLLGSCIAETGSKLHQELWVEELQRDWLEAFELLE